MPHECQDTCVEICVKTTILARNETKTIPWCLRTLGSLECKAINTTEINIAGVKIILTIRASDKNAQGHSYTVGWYLNVYTIYSSLLHGIQRQATTPITIRLKKKKIHATPKFRWGSLLVRMMSQISLHFHWCCDWHNGVRSDSPVMAK